MSNAKFYHFHGRMITVTEAAQITGLTRDAIRYRLKCGMTMEEAVERPIAWKNSDKRKGPCNSRELHQISEYPSLQHRADVAEICLNCTESKCRKGTCKRFREEATRIYMRTHKD